MKFRKEEVDTVMIKSGEAQEVANFVKVVGDQYTIVDVQYGYTVKKNTELHSVLILARKKD